MPQGSEGEFSVAEIAVTIVAIPPGALAHFLEPVPDFPSLRVFIHRSMVIRNWTIAAERDWVADQGNGTAIGCERRGRWASRTSGLPNSKTWEIRPTPVKKTKANILSRATNWTAAEQESSPSRPLQRSRPRPTIFHHLPRSSKITLLANASSRRYPEAEDDLQKTWTVDQRETRPQERLKDLAEGWFRPNIKPPRTNVRLLRAEQP